MNLKTLMIRHNLDRIDISVTARGVVVSAIPGAFHPLVAERRQAWMAAAAAKAGGSISIDEAQSIAEKARAEPVAIGRADTLDIEAALQALEVSLKRLNAEARA